MGIMGTKEPVRNSVNKAPVKPSLSRDSFFLSINDNKTFCVLEPFQYLRGNGDRNVTPMVRELNPNLDAGSIFNPLPQLFCFNISEIIKATTQLQNR